MSEKTIQQVIDEAPGRQVFVSLVEERKKPRYRRTAMGDSAIGPTDFIFMEIDPHDGDPSVARARTWWPAGMVSTELQRGPPMEVPLMFREVRMLMAVNSISRTLVTVHPSLEWDGNWAELVAD